MPAIHTRQPIPDPDAALRIAEECVHRPWDISAEQRAAIVQRVAQVAESEDPWLAINAVWVIIAMDNGNRAAAPWLGAGTCPATSSTLGDPLTLSPAIELSVAAYHRLQYN
jgi:hypothetical protein